MSCGAALDAAGNRRGLLSIECLKAAQASVHAVRPNRRPTLTEPKSYCTTLLISSSTLTHGLRLGPDLRIIDLKGDFAAANGFIPSLSEPRPSVTAKRRCPSCLIPRGLSGPAGGSAAEDATRKRISAVRPEAPLSAAQISLRPQYGYACGSAASTQTYKRKSAAERCRSVPAKVKVKSATLFPFTSACIIVFDPCSSQLTLWGTTLELKSANVNA